MAQDSGRTRFHYGFYAAMKVEYDIMHADVTYEQEIQLGEDPVRLDFLIIKKNSNVVLSDPIGQFFEAVNIFEYKSPEDSLSIDDFYKAFGYTLIYKGYNRKVNELPIKDITLTLVRHSYPRELMKALKQDGFIINEQYPGIFRIDGKINVKTQIIVSSKLPEDKYDGLKLLAKGCTKDDLISYAQKTISSEDRNVKTNAETVIGICLNINKKFETQLLKEEETMMGAARRILDMVERQYNEAKRQVLQKAVQEGRQKGIQEGRQEGIKEGIKEGKQEGIDEVNRRVASDMLRDGEPLEKITKYSRLTEDVVRNLAKNLGVAVMQ